MLLICRMQNKVLQYNSTSWEFSYIFFIVFIGAIIAVFFARSMYRPIEFIMQSFEEDEGTKDDEFAFLSKITQDIKHANEKLKAYN